MVQLTESSTNLASLAQSPEGNSSEMIVRVSPEALELVRQARDLEDSSQELGLWVEISGVGNTGFSYDIYFSEVQEAQAEDSIYKVDDISVVVPASSIKNLRGASLEVSSESGESGLIMINPNKPSAQGLVGSFDPTNTRLDSQVALEILEVLDTQVNPSIASHGGSAELVAIAPVSDELTSADGNDGDKEDLSQVIAYVKLAGGCQGCAMSRATLSQGIEVAIKDCVPQVVGVVDVTDHAGGANPYF
jgi:Fe/S biogenesis protein NfuA